MSEARDIFLVVNSLDALGGVTSWTHRMARLFAARGHRVRVIGVVPSGRDRSAAPEAAPYRSLTLHRRPLPRRRGHGLRARAHPAQWCRRGVRAARVRGQAARLSAVFASARPGGVVIVTQVWAMEWVARADTSGLLVIGMSHESYQATRASTRFPRVRTHYARVDRLLLLTQEDADRWADDGLTHVSWLPNPLPWSAPAPSARTSEAVVSVGRLSDEKGIDLLLAAWATVAPRHPGWTLRIYGSGAPRDERALRARCADLGLSGRVSWNGETADVPGALRDASVFVLPSRAEGFPLALLEAMSMGVPGVAFDCAPGVRELVQDGTDGLLAPPGDPRQLARRLDTLLTDRALRDRLGESARASVQRYAPAEIAQRWERLFTFLER